MPSLGNLPSLGELRAQALAPGATRLERDALIHGMSRPLTPGETARQRADFLLALIEDAEAAELLGSDDRTLRAGAIEALLALGYPYALEIPPDALTRPSAPPTVPNKRAFVGSLLVTLNALVTTGTSTVSFLKIGSASQWPELLLVLLGIGACTLLPLFLSRKGRTSGPRFLHPLGNAMLGLSGLALLALVIEQLTFALEYADVTSAHASYLEWRVMELLPVLCISITQMLSALLLYSPKPREQA